MTIIIGITGNIATGKSTVMRFLGELGAELIDADRVYHELIEPGLPLWDSIRAHFGDAILREDRSIDRRVLGGIVFNNPEKLRELEGLTHAAVRAEIVRRLDTTTSETVAIDAIKLVESKISERCDSLWVVVCDPAIQLERLMTRNGFSRQDALARIKAQPPIDPKVAIADEVIDNSGSVDETQAQVIAGWNRVHLLGKTRR
jgi:dephospho-CoA kinase